MDQGEVRLVGGGVGRQSTLEIRFANADALRTLVESVRAIGILRVPVGDLDAPIRSDVVARFVLGESEVDLAGHLVDWGSHALVEFEESVEIFEQVLAQLAPEIRGGTNAGASSDPLVPHFLAKIDLPEPVLRGEGAGDRGIMMLTARKQWDHTLLKVSTDTESWYFFAQSGVISNAYHMPETAWSCTLGLLQGKGKLDADAAAALTAESRDLGVPVEAVLRSRKLLSAAFITSELQAKVELMVGKLKAQGPAELSLYRFDEPPVDFETAPVVEQSQPAQVVGVAGLRTVPPHEALVMDRFEAMSSPSLFERIGVHWSASRDAIVEATKKLRSDIEAAQQQGLSGEAAWQANQILANLDSWREKLTLTSARRRHRARVIGCDVITQEIEALDADLETALDTGKRTEVFRILGTIREIDPSIVQQFHNRAVVRL